MNSYINGDIIRQEFVLICKRFKVRMNVIAINNAFAVFEAFV